MIQPELLNEFPVVPGRELDLANHMTDLTATDDAKKPGRAFIKARGVKIPGKCRTTTNPRSDAPVVRFPGPVHRITRTRCHWSAILCAVLTVMTSVVDPLYGDDTGPPASLTGQAAASRLPGKFIWADLVTDNVAATRSFYGAMFGWKFRKVDGRLVASNGGHPVAGMSQRQRPANQPNATPRWFGYLSVTDVERARQVVTKSGGRLIVAAHEVPGRGRQAVFADPEGALFGVIRSNANDPADAPAAPGDWIWLQLLSRDAHRAATFYHKVGGYQINRNTAENRSSDYILSSAGIARATIRTIPSGKPAVKPTWLPFVRVLHLDKAAAQAKRLGGAVLVSSRPDLMNGKVAVIADPTGAAVGLLEWNP